MVAARPWLAEHFNSRPWRGATAAAAGLRYMYQELGFT